MVMTITYRIQFRSDSRQRNYNPRRTPWRDPFSHSDLNPSPVPTIGMTVGSETKNIIITTCFFIVKLETSVNKVDAKSEVLE